MNTKDRKRIESIYKLLDSVPFPHDNSGRATASIRGHVMYAADMREFLPMLRDVLYGMLAEHIEDMEAGLDYEEPAEAIQAINAWLEQRGGEKWE